MRASVERFAAQMRERNHEQRLRICREVLARNRERGRNRVRRAALKRDVRNLITVGLIVP